jgi:hypothetical protein
VEKTGTTSNLTSLSISLSPPPSHSLMAVNVFPAARAKRARKAHCVPAVTTSAVLRDRRRDVNARGPTWLPGPTRSRQGASGASRASRASADLRGYVLGRIFMRLDARVS